MATKASEQYIRITLIESKVGNTKRHAANLTALGLRKMQQTVTLPATPDILGKVHYVRHMVKTELVSAEEAKKTQPKLSVKPIVEPPREAKAKPAKAEKPAAKKAEASEEKKETTAKAASKATTTKSKSTKKES